MSEEKILPCPFCESDKPFWHEPECRHPARTIGELDKLLEIAKESAAAVDKWPEGKKSTITLRLGRQNEKTR